MQNIQLKPLAFFRFHFPFILLADPTWPLLARPLLLRKLLDQVVDADVFNVLLEFLVNLQQRWNEWTNPAFEKL